MRRLTEPEIPSGARATALRPAVLPSADVVRLLATDANRGLHPAEARRRLGRFGPNELPPPVQEGWPRRLMRQLREPMALLLMVAAAVSGVALGERLQASAILAIVVLNAAIGVVQEGRAARALDALREMETPTARVVRGGTAAIVPSADVVPGDVVLLSAGDRVPADLRLLAGIALEVDESVLTGESLPVAKDAAAIADPGAGIGDRRGMAYSGTLVTRGAGTGVATATGSRTELGRIAERLRERQPPTPLQRELRQLTARLGAIAVVIASAVLALIVFRTGMAEESLERAFLAAVALAVAAVPEGLATVVTVALALGVRRMATAGAIVRRLPAVETLGSTTLILTDKTGTLTENRMRLEALSIAGEPAIPFRELPPVAGALVAEVAALCSDATLDPPSGDPLEVALLEALGPARTRALRSAAPHVGSVPFDAERRLMTTLHRIRGGIVALTKGAPEAVVARSGAVLGADGTQRPLIPDFRREILGRAADMAERGMRVLALARRPLAEVPGDPADAERDLLFVALAGLRDPVRPEAAPAVAEARSAGISIVMVTGDHPGTASAIAEEAGLAEVGGGPLLTGADLRSRGVPQDPAGTSVYARVEPDQKLALVEAARRRGHVVAVTGDGVNDAPALRRADIGVAMGRAGSDVAREAASMVVTDDNLATIVTAVREGRGIYDNIRKVVDYLVAGNLSEIAVVVVALLLFPELGVPLLPLQLLWINLLTDGLPALALGADHVDPGVMARSPRPRHQRLLGARRIGLLSLRGGLIASSTLGSLAVARFAYGEPWEHARAVMFTVLVAAHLLYAFAARLPTRRLNLWLLAAVVGGILLQAAVVAWPPAHDLFGTAHLAPREWALVVMGGILPTATMVTAHLLGRSALRSPVPPSLSSSAAGGRPRGRAG